MNEANNGSINTVETDVLVLGAGAAGCGAAMAAKKKGVKVLLLDKGKLESTGQLGGGNDHFMAVLDTDPETDSSKAVVNYFQNPLAPYSAAMIEKGWVDQLPPVLDILVDSGVEFMKNEDGSWLRTVGFGQPGPWWINIENGFNVKRLIAKTVRDMDIDVMDHVLVTKLLKNNGKIAGCTGYNVMDGTFYLFKAKKVVIALGQIAARAYTNSTGNPYNIMMYPYTTGSHYIMAYDAGVQLLNLDTDWHGTIIPKGFGAPGMNGINSMGGRQLNALGERFMFKYHPTGENCPRIVQVAGTYQELVEGKGPPFYMDMTHMSEEDIHLLQYILMPGDKATYLDYCEQRGIDFGKYPLEVEISAMAMSGSIMTDDNFETELEGLYDGCVFMFFSGAMCGGYYAGTQAADAALKKGALEDIDDREVVDEMVRVLQPMKRTEGTSYMQLEKTIRQVMGYYMGYRRNQKGMEIALERLNFLEDSARELKADNFHELMRANESIVLLEMCKLSTLASMERKESGRAVYSRTDYPEMDPDLAKQLVVRKGKGGPMFSWRN
jgi:succinate dehydrogenase/fumarate reductase flavoprotein subunit